MTSLCDRLENLAGQLTNSIQALGGSSGPQPATTDKAQADLLQAAQVLRSMPDLRNVGQHDVNTQHHPFGSLTDTSPRGLSNAFNSMPPHGHVDYLPQVGDEDLDSVIDDPEGEASTRNAQDHRGAGALVRDSYGYPR